MWRRILNFMAAWLGPLALRAWFSTIRIRWYGGKYLHPQPGTRGEAIYVMWHERLLCFAYTHAELQGRILVSPSRDGELLARMATGLGFIPIRGSSRRGGSEALRTLLAEVGSGYDFGITPDGPRGPRREFKVGAIYLASRSALPIVPITVSYRQFWQFQSWDRLQFPWPFTSAVIHVGAPVTVPTTLDDAGLEVWRLHLQETLSAHTRVTDERFEEFYQGGRLRRDL